MQLINVHPGARISSQRELQKTPLLRNIDFKKVLQKKATPPFKPPEDHLNCDPSLELEEMIVEAKPLHKKKKRLAKQRSMQKDPADIPNENNLIKEFIVYNRYKELKKKAMELKESEWQDELNKLMANSQVSNLASIQEATAEQTATIQQQNSINKSTTTSSTTTTATTKITIEPSTSDMLNVKKKKINQNDNANDTDENIDYIDRTPSPKITQ